MFFMVAASFFIVCGVSATRFDGYYQYGTVTSTVADSVFYNDLSISAGTESYFDVSFTFGQVSYYNSTMQQITVGSATYSTNIGILEVSCSEPTVDISFDESNRIHCFFQNAYSGDLQFSIKYYIRNTFTGGSPANATMQSITMRRAVTTHYGSMMHSFNGSPSLGVINDKLNQILDALGSSSGSSDFLGDDAYLYFDNRYFSNVYVPNGSASTDTNGLFRWSSSGGDATIGFYNQATGDEGRIVSLFLSPGQYFFISSITNNANVSSISFEGVDSSYYSITPYAAFDSNGYNYTVTLVTVEHPFACNTIYFIYGNATISNAVFYGAVVPADDDFIAGEAVNPDQSGLVEDVDNVGQQQQAQEEQLWTNINSYKGDLTFNLDDWSEAAGGLSYVSSIFMTIWNNSPTQVIVLSLMLGIAMLSIGRGAMAAVRVSRNRRDDD